MRSNKLIKQSIIATGIVAALSGVALAQQGYEVVEIGTVEDTVQSDGRAMNELGHAVGVSTNALNQNIRFDLLDPERFPGIDDFDDMTVDEIIFIRNQLNSLQGLGVDPAFQKLGTELGFYYDGQITNLTDIFDITDPETGLKTDSVNFRAADLNNSGWVAGRVVGPYTRVEGTDAAGREMMFFAWERFPLAVVTNGDTKTYLPGEDGLYFGGTSGARAMNNSGQVVGYASVASNEEMDAYYTRCTNPERVDDDGEVYEVNLEPFPVCMWRLWVQNELTISSRRPFFNEEAYLWEVDEHGELQNRYALGIAFDPAEDEAADEFETISYHSFANDINENGIAVGASVRRTDIGLFSRATVFDGSGEAQRPLHGHEFEDRSRLATINDQGIAVGSISRVMTQFTRNRLFWIDTSVSGAEPVFPSGFFADSGWVARDINNHNQIVGRADTENTLQAQRRTVGFRYDIDEDRMVDLNDLLPCNSGYRIFDAKAINDNGEILATALTSVSIELGDGDVFETQAARTVLLKPSDQQGCVDPEEDQTDNTRKGAAASPVTLGILMTIALITIRRRMRKV